jgi:hypothetical protein
MANPPVHPAERRREFAAPVSVVPIARRIEALEPLKALMSSYPPLVDNSWCFAPIETC